MASFFWASGISSQFSNSTDYITHHITRSLLLCLQHERCLRRVLELRSECVDRVQDKFRAELSFKNGCFILRGESGGGRAPSASWKSHSPGQGCPLILRPEFHTACNLWVFPRSCKAGKSWKTGHLKTNRKNESWHRNPVFSFLFFLTWNLTKTK